eukprot:TRINITY_DN28685_c0_g1_i1.p1 TRINITY_DN28685_c0_g1~~TRINITY_DN28685_c0_g1_i1.p1  ORF type:complete len:665 (+),score=151.63 TRINITY_DN28685_c0_g1_i1:108-2102(+)
MTAQFLPRGARWADISPQGSPVALDASQLQPQLFQRAGTTLQTFTPTKPQTAEDATGKGSKAAAALKSRWADIADSPIAAAQGSRVMLAASPQALASPAASPVAASPVRAQLSKGARWADICSPMQSPVSAQQPKLMKLVSQDGSTWTQSVVLSQPSTQSPATAMAMTPISIRKRPAALSMASSSPASTPPLSERGPDIAAVNSDDEDAALEKLLSQEKQERRQRWADYATTPMHRLPAPSPVNGRQPRFGIDIGGVLTRDGDPKFNIAAEWDHLAEAPGALDAVKRIAQVFGVENTFLVSKVRPGGSMQQKIEHWLHETCRFCEKTGVPKGNIIFTSAADGPNGKGVIASQMGLTHFVDDKIQVLCSVYSDSAGNSGPLIEKFEGLLFHFAKGGCSQQPPLCNLAEMPPMMRKHYCGVANWAEVLAQLRARLPSSLRSDFADKQLEGEARAVPSAASAGASQLRSPSGRPKLQLKPRDPKLGPAGQSAGMPSSLPATVEKQAPQAGPVHPRVPPPMASPAQGRIAPVPTSPPTPVHHAQMPAPRVVTAPSGCSSAAAGAALISSLLGGAPGAQPPSAPAAAATQAMQPAVPVGYMPASQVPAPQVPVAYMQPQVPVAGYMMAPQGSLQAPSAYMAYAPQVAAQPPNAAAAGAQMIQSMIQMAR